MIDAYGIDVKGPVLFTTGSRDLLKFMTYIHDIDRNYMNQLIDPLTHSDCFGIDIYIRCVSFAANRLA